MIHLDFETRSLVDLKKRGVYNYATHPSTDINCMAWAIDDNRVELWLPGDPIPEELIEAVKRGDLIAAWNAGFERLIWNFVLAPKYGFPQLPLTRFYCIAALSRARGYPGALDKAARFAGLPYQKDMEGHHLMLKLCKPRRIEEDGEIVWWDDPREYERLGNYCVQDVEVERAMFHLLLPFTDQELADFHLSEEINDRGVMIDLELAHAAVSGVNTEKLTSDDAMKSLTDGAVTTCNQRDKILAWVEDQWKAIPSLNKTDVLDALQEDDIPPHVAEVLELRLENAKAAVSKFSAMLDRHSHGVVRGLYVFRGAGQTGRYTSFGLQTQNLVRESNLTAIPVLKKRGLAGLKMLGDPVKLLSQMVRPAFVAAPGKTFLIKDFAQIEARVTAWLAGEEKLLSLFRAGKDTYCAFGSVAFKRPITKADVTERFVSKTCIASGELVLTDSGLVPIEQITCNHRVWDGVEWVTHDGLIYQGEREVITYAGLTATPDHRVYLQDGTLCELGRAASEGLEIADTGYGGEAVRVGRNFVERSADRETPENTHAVCELQNTKKAIGQTKRKVWDLLNAGPRHRFTVSGKLVSNCVLGLGFGGAEGALARGLKKEGLVLPMSELTEHVGTYRNTYTEIRKLWYALRDAVLMAMLSPGTMVPVGPVNYLFDGEHLWCRLPSGRLMCYPYTKVVEDEWGHSVEYRRGNRNPKSGVMEWPVVRLWHGMLTENLAQAIAYDLLQGALRRLREWQVRMHIHDEIVTEVDAVEAEVLLEEALVIMTEVPEWAEGLPIAAEGKISDRYVK